jgi:transcriptional repressor NrdR
VHCPACAFDDTKVIDSRTANEGTAIRRRRQCPECGYRFTTFERMEEAPLMVVKSHGGREPFDRTKIIAGLAAAAKGRPVSTEGIELVAEEIEDRLRLEGGEVTSERIGLAVLERLRELDEVAYLRFASVYKAFDDADDFHRELSLLEKRPQPSA